MYFLNTFTVVLHTSLALVFIYQTQTHYYNLNYTTNKTTIKPDTATLIAHYMTETCIALLKQ